MARSERDRGVDLIAYLDLDETAGGFIACPIQMKAATTSSFSLFQKYTKFPRLLLAYVWYVHDPDRECAYALSYIEALGVAEQMGCTSTLSWQRAGYSTTRPSKRLLDLLNPSWQEAPKPCPRSTSGKIIRNRWPLYAVIRGELSSNIEPNHNANNSCPKKRPFVARFACFRVGSGIERLCALNRWPRIPK